MEERHVNPNKLRDRESAHGSGDEDDAAKRLAVKELIERYYYQLTDGCGRENCTNQNCASSGCLEHLSSNDAAAMALQLVVSKAELCVGAAILSAEPHHQDPCESTTSCTEGATSQGTGATALMAAHCNTNLEDMDMDEECSSRASTINVTTPRAKQTAAGCGSVEMASQDMELDLCCTLSSEPINCSQPLEIEESSPLDYDRGSPKQKTPSQGLRVYHRLTYELLLELLEECNSQGSYAPLIHVLGQVYSRVAWLKRSFTERAEGESPSGDGLSKEDRRALEMDMDKDEDCQAVEEAECSSPDDDYPARFDDPVDQEITVDTEAVRRAYDALFSIPDHPFFTPLVNAIRTLCKDLEFGLRYRNAYERTSWLLNVFVILLELPLLEGPFWSGTVQALCQLCSLLPLDAQERLVRYCAYNCPPHRLRNMVNALQQVLTARAIEGTFTRECGPVNDHVIVVVTKTLKILFMASVVGGQLEQSVVDEDGAEDYPLVAFDGDFPSPPREDPLCVLLGVKVTSCRKPLIPLEEFYNEPLSELLEMDLGFAHPRGTSRDGTFSFLSHAFVLTPAIKTLGLCYDNRVRMSSERHLSVIQMLVGGIPADPYLKVIVRREHLIHDALCKLELVAVERPSNLKKQLVVEFDGEQGIDEGGVSKEFFQLIVDQLFNPDFAMFTLNPETQTYWFNPTSFESDAQFKLIGIILGLAIYNNVILDVHFPMVVYRKLLRLKGTFYDLKDWNPSLAEGLQQLLDYKGEDMEETFMQSFRISYQDVFGAVLTHDLREGGNSIMVDQENKWEFVDLYADFLLNKSIEKQFRAFRYGFHLVTDDSPLESLFLPEEVELLVCGSKIFDFNALEESAQYEGGYSRSSEIIIFFWELVHEFSLEQKRKLLQFTTGSDRVPVGGLSKLKLIISRNGTDSDRLPTAHTCFNILLLPDYASKAKLKDRLLKAINYSKGFGMF